MSSLSSDQGFSPPTSKHYRQNSIASESFSPSSNVIPDKERERIRRALSISQSVDTTKSNAPANMTRPPIGLTDANFGGRDRSVRVPGSSRSTKGTPTYNSFARSPPVGLSAAFFGSSTGHGRMGSSVPAKSPVPGLMSLDDGRRRRDIIPSNYDATPTGVMTIQQEENFRRALNDRSEVTRRASIRSGTTYTSSAEGSIPGNSPLSTYHGHRHGHAHNEDGSITGTPLSNEPSSMGSLDGEFRPYSPAYSQSSQDSFETARLSQRRTPERQQTVRSRSTTPTSLDGSSFSGDRLAEHFEGLEVSSGKINPLAGPPPGSGLPPAQPEGKNPAIRNKFRGFFGKKHAGNR